MKSKKVKELCDWLDSSTRIIDRPRSFSLTEVMMLTEIAELELSGDNSLLDEKILEFKKAHFPYGF